MYLVFLPSITKLFDDPTQLGRILNTLMTLSLLSGDDRVCPPQDRCKAQNGTCKKKCNSKKHERELKWLCDPNHRLNPYEHFPPLAPKPLNTPPSPLAPKLQNILTGSACKCCAPKCEESSTCTRWGGTCVNGAQECPTQYGYMVIDGCKGYNCKCCIPSK